MSAIGMSQAYLFYNSFDINVFEYSELNDFALAAFKEPKIFLIGLALSAYMAVILLVTQSTALLLARFYFKKKIDAGSLRTQSKAISALTILFIFIVPIIWPNIINDNYSDDWKKDYLDNPHNQASIKLRVSSVHGIKNGDIKNLTILGTTDKYYFFYDKKMEMTLMIPISNILYVQHS